VRRPSLPRPGPLAAAAGNLVPLFGVVSFGWSATALLGVYFLEVLAVLFWTVVKIPFAYKRPNNAIDRNDRLLGPIQAKRGATALPGRLPDVYVRNLPSLLITVFLLAPFEAGVCLIVFSLADPTITDAVAGQMLLGGVAVFLGRGVETYLDYFRGGGYRDHSARSLLLGPFKALFAVGTLMFVLGPMEGAFGSDALLALVVVGKLLYDLRTVQVESEADKRGVFYRLYGSEETEPEPERVAVPDGEPTYRERPPRRAALADALFRGVTYSVTSVVAFAYLIGGALVFFGVPLFGVPFLAAGLGFTLLRAFSRYLSYGTVEYRCYGDTLVVHDAVLGEPQARLERGAVTGLELYPDPVDRRFGTETLDFETDAGDARPDLQLTIPDPEDVESRDPNANRSLAVAHVEDPEALAEAFGVAWRLGADG
jgi:hypothetical protein